MLWIVLLSIDPTQACPKVYCGNERSSYCVTWNPNSTEAILHPCPPGSQCPSALFSSQQDLHCTDPPAYPLDLWNPYYASVGSWYAYSWKTEGEFCDQIEDICHPGSYCDSTNHTCSPGKLHGQTCIQGQCTLGLVCNLGVCVPAGSIPLGQTASTSFACAQFTLSSDFHCTTPAQSRSPPPIPCLSDRDCEGNDGSPGVCQCAYNQAGTAYCALHPGDRIYQDFLKAQAEMNYRNLPGNYYKTKYFAWIVDANECSYERIPELFMYTAYNRLSLLLIPSLSLILG